MLTYTDAHILSVADQHISSEAVPKRLDTLKAAVSKFSNNVQLSIVKQDN